MKDTKLTELMLKSLKKDPSLATFEDWEKAGDYAAEIRFFPHAFNCYQNAFTLTKTEAIAEKLNTILDKITHVLELVPEELKPLIEEIRLNNPLDPGKWLAIANDLLRKANETGNYASAKLALAFTAYCALRSGGEVEPINEILTSLISPSDGSLNEKLELKSSDQEQYRVVALGDNVTLGVQNDWEVNFRETYHYLWANESDQNISLANCGVSGAGMMDAMLYLGRDVLYYKPNLVFINFGTNDAWLGRDLLPAYEALLDSVISLLKPICKIVLISPIPHIPENCPEHLRPSDIKLEEVAIEPWVEAARRAASRNAIVLADAYAEFPQDKLSREKYFANKFNQLNLEGQKLILKAINKVVQFV